MLQPIQSSKLCLKNPYRKGYVTWKKDNWHSKDFSWVTNGLYRLLRSRRVLSFQRICILHVWGWLILKDEMTEKEKEIKQTLFEDQQRQLETNVEKLTIIVEQRFQSFDQHAEDEVQELRMISIENCMNALRMICWVPSSIAPWMLKGVGKASELLVCRDTKADDNEKNL